MVRSRLAWTVATWFGCGRVPIAPGTAGTLGALPLYLAVRPLGAAAVLLTAGLVTAVGVWAAGHVVRDTREPDPQIIVVDEVAGVLITLAAAGPRWSSVALGVVLFRVFDQWKPWPARSLESLPRGWGVVMDDVAAGGWGAVVLLVARAMGLP